MKKLFLTVLLVLLTVLSVVAVRDKMQAKHTMPASVNTGTVSPELKRFLDACIAAQGKEVLTKSYDEKTGLLHMVVQLSHMQYAIDLSFTKADLEGNAQPSNTFFTPLLSIVCDSFLELRDYGLTGTLSLTGPSFGSLEPPTEGDQVFYTQLVAALTDRLEQSQR